MGAAVSITRLDLTAQELRKASGAEKDGAVARRMLALALVLDGVDRKTAAETCGMDRQTLRDWVHRYNAEGVAGLGNLKPPGRSSVLTAQQLAVLADLVESGPDRTHPARAPGRRDVSWRLLRRRRRRAVVLPSNSMAAGRRLCWRDGRVAGPGRRRARLVDRRRSSCRFR